MQCLHHVIDPLAIRTPSPWRVKPVTLWSCSAAMVTFMAKREARLLLTHVLKTPGA